MKKHTVQIYGNKPMKDWIRRLNDWLENFSQSPSLRTLSKVASGLDLKITFIDKNTNELVNH